MPGLRQFLESIPEYSWTDVELAAMVGVLEDNRITVQTYGFPACVHSVQPVAPGSIAFEAFVSE